MILAEVQGYLREKGRVSVAQMELHFGVEPDALRGMLDRLVRKGRARKLPTPRLCGGCSICAPETIEFYEWTAARPANRAAEAPECCAPGGGERPG